MFRFALASLPLTPLLAVLVGSSDPRIGLLNSMGNLGGMGLLAAALLWLYTGAIKQHRADLAAERESCQAGFLAVKLALESLTECVRSLRDGVAPREDDDTEVE